jgi:hypothetical protein
MSLILSGDSPKISADGTGVLTSRTAVASTSGTSIDFTSIPSWVKRITVMYSGLSTNGLSGVQVQLGTSDGLTTSGYTGVATYVGATNSSGGTSYTTGLPLANMGSGDVTSGMTVIALITGNTWVSTTVNGHSNNNYGHMGGGGVTLSGTLDRIRINSVNGTDTFDAGSINILYE